MSLDDAVLLELEDAYAFLANIHNQWPGRHTLEGQQRLNEMLRVISEARHIDEEEVRTSLENRYLIASVPAQVMTSAGGALLGPMVRGVPKEVIAAVQVYGNTIRESIMEPGGGKRQRSRQDAFLAFAHVMTLIASCVQPGGSACLTQAWLNQAMDLIDEAVIDAGNNGAILDPRVIEVWNSEARTTILNHLSQALHVKPSPQKSTQQKTGTEGGTGEVSDATPG